MPFVTGRRRTAAALAALACLWAPAALAQEPAREAAKAVPETPSDPSVLRICAAEQPPRPVGVAAPTSAGCGR